MSSNINELLKTFKDKICVVTGGTGLIGRQVVKLLVDAGAKVRVWSLDDIKPVDGATYVKIDLCDSKLIDFAMPVYTQYFFHLAGIKGSVEVTKSRPATFFVPYLKFNTNVLEAARKLENLQGFVYTSSIGAYSSSDVFIEGQNEDGVPMDTYPGWAKRMAELQINAYREEYGIKNFHIVRPCNVYGPGDNFDPDNAMVIPSLMYKIDKYQNNPDNGPIQIWGDGSAIRDFAYSKDIAIGIIQAILKGTFYQHYEEKYTNYVNLASGNGISIAELVEALYDVTGGFSYTFDTSKSSGFSKRVMSIELAKKLLGYEHTTTLKEGLKETWDWFQKNKNEFLNKKNYFKE